MFFIAVFFAGGDRGGDFESTASSSSEEKISRLVAHTIFVCSLPGWLLLYDVVDLL